MDREQIHVEVDVECPATGIRATHYVAVDASLIHPLAYAANQERDKGYRILATRLWQTKQRGQHGY